VQNAVEIKLIVQGGACLPAAAGRGRGEQGEIATHTPVLMTLYGVRLPLQTQAHRRTKDIPHRLPCSPRPRKRGALHDLKRRMSGSSSLPLHIRQRPNPAVSQQANQRRMPRIDASTSSIPCRTRSSRPARSRADWSWRRQPGLADTTMSGFTLMT
jgi:hypothetical protein